MYRISSIISILVILALQSCCFYRTVQEKEYSRVRKLFKKSYERTQYHKYNGKIQTVETEKLIYFLYDMDTIEFELSLSGYTNLFTSGLISPTLFIDPSIEGHHVSIYNIYEIINCFNRTKIRKYEFEGSSNFFNGFKCYLEIRNDQASQKSTMDEFFKGAHISFLISEVKM